VEKFFDFNFRKVYNVTDVFVQNLCFYCAWFFIQGLFKTTPCLLKRQRKNHTGVLAKDRPIWLFFIYFSSDVRMQTLQCKVIFILLNTLKLLKSLSHQKKQM